MPRKVDYHPLAVPVPYNHSNVDSVHEVMFYGMRRRLLRGAQGPPGIGQGSVSLHPGGHSHGPQPGAVERSLGAEFFDELAVMVDTFRPLALGEAGRAAEDPGYAWTWSRPGPRPVSGPVTRVTRLPDLVTGLCDDAAMFPPGLAPLDRAVAAYLDRAGSWYRDLAGPLVVAAGTLAAMEGMLPHGGTLPVSVTVIPASARRTSARSSPGPRRACRCSWPRLRWCFLLPRPFPARWARSPLRWPGRPGGVRRGTP